MRLQNDWTLEKSSRSTCQTSTSRFSARSVEERISAFAASPFEGVRQARMRRETFRRALREGRC